MSTVLEKIRAGKIVAIIRGLTSEYILDTVQALKDGGIDCVEVTFNQNDPEASKDTLKSIQLLREHFGDSVAVGAGTVMSEQEVADAAKAGAQYIVSPNVDFDVIRKTKELGLVSIPGAFTPSEAQSAYKAGADIIKLFPAGELGPDYVRALVAPLNHIPFMPVFEISEKDAHDYIAAGAVAVGVGGNLVNKKLIAEGKFDEIRQLAEKYKALL